MRGRSMDFEMSLGTNVSFDLIVSLFTIVFLLGFVLFSFLVTRQVSVMCGVVESNLNSSLKTLAKIQLLAGVIVLVLSILIVLI